ncbi:MAG: hypothetical protein M3Y76_06205 [Chloroflexota bacterium]|nr:hypothetical protein [Chloroflexota bacterium]
MNNPQFLTIFTVVFILLGCYNIFIGLRRQREAQARGRKTAWYQQINLLTGLEYLLLSFVFIMSININNHTLPAGLKSIVVPFYVITLLSSAVLAGFVIRQAFVNSRRTRQNTVPQPARNGLTESTYASTDDEFITQRQATSFQHRRERRQKAAATRRRRSGKA